ncbi:MAG: hypothetical protein ACAI38_13505 [Myxococcota bacterium]
MLSFAIVLVTVSAGDVEVFATVGQSAQWFVLPDGEENPAGIATGGGVAYAWRPFDGRFTLMPRLDVQRIIGGPERSNLGHFAFLIGGTGAHFRPTIGPSLQVGHSFWGFHSAIGMSVDLAFLYRPLVFALFGDAGLGWMSAARVGLRLGVMF